MSAPETDPPALDVRRRDTGDVRALIERLSAAATRAEAVRDAPARLLPEVRRLVSARLTRQADARLRELDLAELRPYLKPGTKLLPFEQHGFDSIAALLEAPRHGLAAINGVSAETADQVRDAAEQVRAQITADAGFNFDPSHPDDDQTALLAHLRAIATAEAAVKEFGPGLSALIETAESLIPRAKPVSGGLRKFFAFRRRTKDAAFEAAAEIERRLDDDTPLLAELAAVAPRVDPRSHRPDELWRAFEADAASFYSRLSALGSTTVDAEHDAARGHIGRELAQQVAGTALDTRLVKAALRGYQHFGAQFVIRRRRAILGDEMGLGKTVQALAACAHLAASGRSHFLVVCPASVLLNWLWESEKHTLLTAHKLHGGEREREEAGRAWLREGGLAVTTFDTLPRLRCLAEADSIVLLIVDEAHYVKNQGTKRAQAIRPFIDRSEHALFLSGTPLENRISEFRALVEYLRPDVAERIGAHSGLAGAKSFRRKVAEVYLRRNQTDVLAELPDKIEVEEWVEFTRQDQQIYRGTLEEPHTIGLLEKLRHVAYQAPDSAKLTRTVELVREAASDDLKVVVFSRYLNVLTRLSNELGDLECHSLTGSVPAQRRQGLIEEFTGHDGAAVLLAQIDTGGTGINLQSASVVIITEPQWKPSVEDQAVARLHRMGQVRPVQVHRILAKETVDELLLRAQDHKRLLFDEFARESHAKDADRQAVDTTTLPSVADDESIPLELRILKAERERVRRDHD